jgi:hypothetical protein
MKLIYERKPGGFKIGFVFGKLRLALDYPSSRP